MNSEELRQQHAEHRDECAPEEPKRPDPHEQPGVHTTRAVTATCLQIGAGEGAEGAAVGGAAEGQDDHAGAAGSEGPLPHAYVPDLVSEGPDGSAADGVGEAEACDEDGALVLAQAALQTELHDELERHKV